jgi:hypothetical protein
MVIPKEHGILKINTQPNEANGPLFQEHSSFRALFDVKHGQKIILLYHFSKHSTFYQILALSLVNVEMTIVYKMKIFTWM